MLTRRALVTGGTRGIGFEIAQMLLRKNYEVVFTGRTPESVNTALKRYGNHPNVVGVVLDASKPIVEKIPCHFDTVIHNAGMLSRDNLLDINYSKMEKMFAINAISPLSLTKMYLPYMIRQRRGNIFFFCPPYKIDAKTRLLTPYMQTKLAQTTLMYSLANMISHDSSLDIKVAGFWTDYPIYTDALIHRKIGAKENCMGPGIVAKTVELMLEDDSKNVHGNVMIDHDYLKEKGVDTKQWALGEHTQRLDNLFMKFLGNR